MLQGIFIVRKAEERLQTLHSSNVLGMGLATLRIVLVRMEGPSLIPLSITRENVLSQ